MWCDWHSQTLILIRCTANQVHYDRLKIVSALKTHKRTHSIFILIWKCLKGQFMISDSYWFSHRWRCLCWLRWDRRRPHWQSTECRGPASAGLCWSSSLRPVSIYRKHVSSESMSMSSNVKVITIEQKYCKLTNKRLKNANTNIH